MGGLVGNLNGGAVSASSASGTVSGSNLENSDKIGGLVGHLLNGSSIDGSFATGSVTGNSKTGGLVGEMQSGTGTNSITNSYASGTISGTGTTNASFDIGGLVGYAAGGVIAGSYKTATSIVTGKDNIGGVIG